jgi:hypothetical protein
MGTAIEISSALNNEQDFKERQRKYKKTSDESQASPEMKLYDDKDGQRTLIRETSF